jgi:hypothetical protein
MPISVTCPECQYHFLVGDEFAGHPGRCPECAAVIHVPGPEATRPPEQAHPDPYSPRRVADQFDDFPSRTRRSRHDYERRRAEDDLRDDYDDEPRVRSFDREARAAAWNRVFKGLGNVQIAIILYFFGQLLQMGFILAQGLDNLNNNANALPGAGEIAVGIGGLVVILAAGGFWIVGRLGGIRVPYVPARKWAKVSFFMSLAGVAAMVAFCCSFLSVIVMLGQQGPNPGAIMILMLAVMIMFVGGVLLVVAEVCALMSMVKIGEGLRATGVATWARHSLVLLIVLIFLLMSGFCGLTIYAANKQKQKGPPAGNPPAKQQNNPPAAPKDKDTDKAGAPNGPGQQPNQQQNQQQNPFEDDGLDEKTKFAAQSAMIGLILLYLIHYSIGLQKCRRAIREEMHGLMDSHDVARDDRDVY